MPKIPPPSAAHVDSYLQKIIDIIDTKGWAVQGVMSNPPIAYTVGLTITHGLPEIVVAALPLESAVAILNGIAKKLIDKKYTLEADKDYPEVFEGFKARFRPLSAEVAAQLKVAAMFTPGSTPGETPVVAWQLIWPDTTGHFPGQLGMDSDLELMQDLKLILSEGGAPH
jgi:hypothetical protein